MKPVCLLAIESSADETSAAVLFGGKKTKQFRLASNVIYSQIKIHQKTGGIVPEVAARNHILKILPIIELALAKAKINLKQVDVIAVTAGPGLITSLMIGVDTAKALAFTLKKPLIAVNHMEGHLLSALGGKNFQFSIFNLPALGLIVSGGHTMLVLVKKIGEYKILGETVDDAAGECFDKVAKIMKLPYPGGPSVAQRATKFKVKNAKLRIDLPRPMLDSKNYNFSFSGLKTAVLYKVRELGKLNNDLINQIAYETQQAIIDVLVAKTIRAAKELKVKTILLGGGVSANTKLRAVLAAEIKENLNSRFLIPDSSLTTDNAGMIAIAAWFKFLRGETVPVSKIRADPNWEIA
ncbi:MAG: tRNA (adenosine(37)-N6)-threonylcarbamoyltransferase complex transferase subunit TsaD [Candidatus Magasanikbacteria bacterium RIFCSPHIGHO2_01_FULL_47_8]|uniref:tRNA N6-adenosine threonylcarbamoyltransferase n=1 Tax=Candidatus Magasanikbacteria bacterium RIFCSPHIGHO2_01_FULL_47_8 TaxID=1798673 RepID=A0A1F6MDF2_9BACT|nr:MAG: tRNA (adenosine(37)-N6)-threonylcarbamoyltransferase complex transferase subunit TsaD [Candidatus Magasanikbacteria bacterium RIFCSPHIGHO2_01_FULL_47_8]